MAEHTAPCTTIPIITHIIIITIVIIVIITAKFCRVS